MRKTLLLEFYKYGMHLGSDIKYNTNLNYFILGTRFKFAIIDMNKSFFFIKKALLFLKTLASQQGSICFYHTLFTSMGVLYKSCLIGIVLKSFQSIVVHPWLYGSINNYYFSYFFFIKDILGSWSKGSFFATSTNSFLDTYKNTKYQSLNTHFDKNKNFFFRNDFSHTIHNVLKSKRTLKSTLVFFKFFYFLHAKKKDYTFLNKESDNNLPSDIMTKRVLFYWRLLLYYKHFQNFFELPDSFFIVSPDQNNVPIKEVSRSNEIISIGLVDTDCNIDGIHYPIVVNDDTMVIVYFFFTLFSNIFVESTLSMYKTLYSK